MSRRNWIIYFVLAACLVAVIVAAQDVVVRHSGVPSGTCTPAMLAEDSTTGKTYVCPSGQWVERVGSERPTTPGLVGNTITVLFPGAPTGTCSFPMRAVNRVTGQHYHCLANAWVGTTTADKLVTSANCASAGGSCGAASAGAMTIAAAATTVTVSTTSVNAASRIFLGENSTLGAELGVTCNVVTGRVYTVTTVTAGTSFVVTASAAPATNPACLEYFIVN